ncbi:MAG: hypothetical protein NVS1B11_28350 [Terriglobales bacterium]
MPFTMGNDDTLTRPVYTRLGYVLHILLDEGRMRRVAPVMVLSVCGGKSPITMYKEIGLCRTQLYSQSTSVRPF